MSGRTRRAVTVRIEGCREGWRGSVPVFSGEAVRGGFGGRRAFCLLLRHHRAHVGPELLGVVDHAVDDRPADAADSLDLVELVMHMEEVFNVEIPDEDAEGIRTVQDAINYVQQHKEA